MITKDDYAAMAGPDWPSYNDFIQNKNVPDFVLTEINEMLSAVDRKLQENRTFCSLPFYAMEYPLNTHCCLMSRGRPIEDIRNDMLNAVRPPECNKCWKLEDVGLISDRMIKNSMMDHLTKQDILYIADECRSGKNRISCYKISTNNVCNATCVTCNSPASSAWGKLKKQNNLEYAPIWQIEVDNLGFDIDYSSAKALSFLGGESTLSKTNFDILEKLLDHDNRDCFITFVTNGSFTLTPWQEKLIAEFRNFEFCFSIDGIGSVFEYARYPLRWKDIVDNIEYCKGKKREVNASFTVSNFNLYYFDETINWFKSNSIKHNVNLVYSPVWFRPDSLPLHIKQFIITHNPGLAKSNFLKAHTSEHDINYQKFLIEIAKQDQMKRISIENYLPEFWKLTK